MNEDNSGHNVKDEEDSHKDNHMDEQDYMRRDAIRARTPRREEPLNLRFYPQPREMEDVSRCDGEGRKDDHACRHVK